MKKQVLTSALLLLLSLVMIFSFVACAKKVPAEGIWESATYRADKTFGKGDKTITFKVTAEEQTVTFTVKTDKETLADALLEHELIAGEDSAYGLMVETVDGMTAKYAEGYWWALYEGDQMASVGASSLAIKDGGVYTFSRVAATAMG